MHGFCPAKSLSHDKDLLACFLKEKCVGFDDFAPVQADLIATYVVELARSFIATSYLDLPVSLVDKLLVSLILNQIDGHGRGVFEPLPVWNELSFSLQSSPRAVFSVLEKHSGALCKEEQKRFSEPGLTLGIDSVAQLKHRLCTEHPQAVDFQSGGMSNLPLRSKVTYSLETEFKDLEHYLDTFYEYVRHCSEEFYNSDEYYAANGVLARSFGYGKTKLLLELENHLPLLPLCIRHSKEPGQSGRTRKVHRVERQVPRRD